MLHKLSVTVRVDLDLSVIQLLTTGCLTEDSHQSLLALIFRARSISPSGQVTVDLTETQHIEAAGLTLLRSAIDLDERENPGQPVLVLVPDSWPLCPLTDAAATGGRY